MTDKPVMPNPESTLISRDDIFAADDLSKTVTVAVPEWGGDVIVKTLTSSEIDKFTQSLEKGKGRVSIIDARAKLVVLAAVDNKGERLFHGKADVASLGKKSAAAVTRVFKVAQELAGISDDDMDEYVEDFDNDLFEG